MKLIIDIPEETYNDIQLRDWKNGELIFSEEWKAIHYGTPLDDLRAEIDEIPLSEPMVSADGLYCYGSKSITMGHFREKVLEIIDRYKERSE